MRVRSREVKENALRGVVQRGGSQMETDSLRHLFGSLFILVNISLQLCNPSQFTYKLSLQDQSKVWTPSHSKVLLYIYCCLHCRFILKTSKLWYIYYASTYNFLKLTIWYSHPCRDWLGMLRWLFLLTAQYTMNAFRRDCHSYVEMITPLYDSQLSTVTFLSNVVGQHIV